ncbi:MAG: hypothetical protein RMM51_03920 [Verrucomicrobiae bacterium]|nr:hypothetical protein [Verrucomicrobiae bacterium]
MKQPDFSWTAGLADQQLKGWRRWWAERHLARNPVAAVEYREQVRARELLHENPPHQPVPEPTDVFWARVRADIEQRHQTTPVPHTALASWWTRLWTEQPLVVVSAVLALLIAAAFVTVAWHRARVTRTAATEPTAVHRVATTIPHTVASPFHVPETGATCIWISGLPWTPDMTEMQTLFAHLDS